MPGHESRTLAHVFYCISVFYFNFVRSSLISATATETKSRFQFVHPYQHFNKFLLPFFPQSGRVDNASATVMSILMKVVKNFFSFISSVLESCFGSSGYGNQKHKSVRRKVRRRRHFGKEIRGQFIHLLIHAVCFIRDTL